MKSEIQRYFWINLVVYQVAGIWSPYYKKKTTFGKVCYELYKYAYMGICILYIIQELVVVMIDYRTLNKDILTVHIAYVIQHTVGLVKCYIVLSKQDELRWLMDQTQQPPLYRENNKFFDKELAKIMKESRFVVFTLWFAIFSTVNNACIGAILKTYANISKMDEICKGKYDFYMDTINLKLLDVMPSEKYYDKVMAIENFLKVEGIFEQIRSDNRTMETLVECTRPHKVLPWIAWFPFDTTTSPVYELTYLFEYILLWIFAFYIFASDLLIMCMMKYLAFQFELLNDDLLNLREISENTVLERMGKLNDKSQLNERIVVQEMENRLRKIIVHHVTILRYFEKTNEVITWILFAQYFCNTILICVMLFQLSTSPIISVKFAHIAFYSTVVLFQLYMNFYYGNEIMLQSMKISNAAYHTDWEKSSEFISKIAIYIKLLMQRSNRPIKFTAGTIFSIDLATFLNVGKASYSYYTLLKKSK